jgi:CheY-like chemotaxis protein
MSAEAPRGAASVLLVDDNPDDRELTLAALAGIPARVEVAGDGVEALECLNGRGRWAGRPDFAPTLLLLDLKMPRLDGVQALSAIRNDPRLATMAVVILTSSDEECDRERCRQLGVTDYLRKTVDFALFREQLRRLWLRWAGEQT